MKTNKRLTNWDLLRALSTNLVIVVLIALQLGSFRSINASAIAGTAAIIFGLSLRIGPSGNIETRCVHHHAHSRQSLYNVLIC
mgnify:CR=1 FL=1